MMMLERAMHLLKNASLSKADAAVVFRVMLAICKDVPLTAEQRTRLEELLRN